MRIQDACLLLQPFRSIEQNIVDAGLQILIVLLCLGGLLKSDPEAITKSKKAKLAEECTFLPGRHNLS